MKSVDVHIERDREGTPSAGRVLAAVFPHADDFPILAGGTIAKLIREGYRGFLIRMTNDEKDSVGLSVGETIARNEAETRQMARIPDVED